MKFYVLIITCFNSFARPVDGNCCFGLKESITQRIIDSPEQAAIVIFQEDRIYKNKFYERREYELYLMEEIKTETGESFIKAEKAIIPRLNFIYKEEE